LEQHVQQICDRIDVVEPEVQALLPEPDRRARLLREARELARRYPGPQGRPPLYGVLVGVKDIFRVDGFPTRCGSALPAELFEGPEATVVTRLRKAGALILGKTVTTEFAYFEPGPTRNPWNTEHTPGGSSSGSAAAVAAGYCPLALGTQTVGSVIRPAAFCGIAGFKPTRGLVPTDGVIPYAPSLDHVGFFTACAEDLSYAFSAVTGEYEEDDPPGLAELGYPDGPYLEQAPPETREWFRHRVRELQESGRKVRAIRTLEDIDAINSWCQIIARREIADTHGPWFDRYEALYRPRTAEWIRAGRSVLGAELAEAYAGLQSVQDEIVEAMDAAGVQALICPAAAGPAPVGIASTGDPVMNLPWTFAGLPVATVPSGTASNGLPLGIQYVGAPGDDRWLAISARQLAL
jgi:Asp-tRNA(Asn)/Glu-tRNA(Gln) amidotransferase A subunit family amidase